MSSKYHQSSQNIIHELNTDYFSQYKDNILEALVALDKGQPFDHQMELAANCLQEFWKNYSREKIAKIFWSFPRVQRALFGLEETLEDGVRYRDHYIHMLDTFITGSRIISQIISLVPPAERQVFLKETFKIVREPDQVPFPRPYSVEHRLLFLWTIIATFHDIGIPIEHLGRIRDGLNNFLSYFGLRLGELHLEQKTNVDAQLPYYFGLMSKFLEPGIIPNDDLIYDKAKSNNQYLYQVLATEYGEYNHAVISAVCLFNSFEETFLIGHHDQNGYDLDINKHSGFMKLVFEQDIARAALAISFHNLDTQRFPKIFPIKFEKFPLAFLLILCDNLQEAFRREGISFSGITKLSRFPYINVKVVTAPPTIEIAFTICYVNLAPEEEQIVLASATAWAGQKGISMPSKYSEFLSQAWERICSHIKEKLLFQDSSIKLRISVYYEEDKRRKRLILSERF